MTSSAKNAYVTQKIGKLKKKTTSMQEILDFRGFVPFPVRKHSSRLSLFIKNSIFSKKRSKCEMLVKAPVSPPHSHYVREVYDIDILPSLSVNKAIDVCLLLHLFVRCWYFNDYSSLGLSFYKFFQGSKQSHYIESMWFELAIKER